MEYTVHGNKHGWGDLFIEIKLGFAGWINVFFCLTGGESIRRFGMSVTARDSSASLKPFAQVNTKTCKDPTAEHQRNPRTWQQLQASTRYDACQSSAAAQHKRCRVIALVDNV